MKPQQYKLTFAWLGLLVMALLQLPNLLWILSPPAYDPLSTNSTAYPVLDIIENASLVLVMLSLIFIRPRDGLLSSKARLLTWLGGACIVAYYVLWGLYRAEIISPLSLLGMAVFPVLCYVFFTLRVRNHIVLPLIGILAVFHIGITAANYPF